MKTALVIDDNKTNRKVISAMLARFHISAVEACDGKQGLELLNQNEGIEIAFVDWNMPVMSGIEFLQVARTSKDESKLKVVMVTSNTDMNYVVSALESGASEYIMLPLTREVLQEKLALLGIYPKEQEG